MIGSDKEWRRDAESMMLSYLSTDSAVSVFACLWPLARGGDFYLAYILKRLLYKTP